MTGTESTDTRSLITQTFHLVGGQGLVLVLAVATNVIAARALLPAGRGALAFGLQVAFVSSFVILFGLEKALPVVRPRDSVPHGVSAIWRQAWPRAVIAGLLGTFLTGVALASDGPPGWLAYAVPVAVMAVASAIARAFEASSINAGRAQLMLYEAAVASSLTLIAVALLWQADVGDPIWWLLAYGVIALAVGLALTVWFGKLRAPSSDLLRRRGRISDDLDVRLRRTGYKLFPASMASFAALRSDRLILPILDGTESLGLYVVIATLTDVVATPVEALSNVLVPRWRAAFLDGELRTRPIFLGVFVYLAIACTGAVVVGGVLLVPLFGEAYEPARRLLPVLAIGSALFVISRLTSTRRMAQGYVSLVSVAEVAGMTSAVAGYLVLIPIAGPMGAAIGAIIGYTSSLLVLLTGIRWAIPGAVPEESPPDGSLPDESLPERSKSIS